MHTLNPIPVRGILFDLDGTLVDSVPDIAHAANRMLQTLGLPVVEIETLATWVGNGAGTLVKRALTGEINGQPDAALFGRALPVFFDHYADQVFVRTTLYPGVTDTLDLFQSHRFPMACVTNKPQRHTLALLEQSGLADYFSCVVAAETTPKIKPHPLPLFHACSLMELSADSCLMVGDSINDIKAANAASMPVACMSYGYNQGMDLSNVGADLTLDHFSDLPNFVCKSA